MNIKKFECVKCGTCCKELGLREGDRETPYFLDKFNIILNKPTLPLKNWETEIFRKEIIVPSSIVFDQKNERSIILSYTLNTSICPFIENNSCKIYKNRPLVCKSFPCNASMVYDKILNQVNVNIKSSYDYCKSELSLDKVFKIIGLNTDKKSIPSIQKKLYLRYGDSYIYNLISKYIDEKYSKFIINLIKNNVITLTEKGCNIKLLKERIDKSKFINISELHKEHTGEDLSKYQNLFADSKKKYQDLKP